MRNSDGKPVIHARRHGSNRRASRGLRAPWGRARTTPLCQTCDWAPPQEGSLHCKWCAPFAPKAETRHESMDDVHPGNAQEAVTDGAGPL